VVLKTNRTIRLIASQRLVQLVGKPADGQAEDWRCFTFGPKASFGRLGVAGETRVEGLLPEALTLVGRYSQTLLERGRYGHETVHEVICDPWLEATLTQSQKAALTAANVRLLYYYHYRFGDVTERFLILGLDGTFRAVP
jgi:hypothetical protein